MAKNKSLLGKRLDKVMISNGIYSQVEFCEKVGLDKTTVSRLMSGDKSLNMNHLIKILKAFPEVNANWLILGDGDSDYKTADADSDLQAMKIIAQQEMIEALRLNKKMLKKQVSLLEMEIECLKGKKAQ